MPRPTTTTTTKSIDYSIPGKFVVIIQPNTEPPPPEPPVIGHCILCFRRLRGSTVIQNLKIGETLDDLKIVPKAVLPEDHLLPTFNKLLPFIHRKWKQNKENNCFDLLNKSAPDSGSGGPSSLPKNFPHLPAMCTFCGQQIQQLDGLIKKLGGKIEEIKGIIKKSKMSRGEYGWRQEQFEEDLRNNEDLNEMSRRRTMEFYEGFGEVEEEDDGELAEEELVVEATRGEEGVEEEDPLAFVEEEVEEGDEFVVKVEVEGDFLENFVDEDDEQNEEEGWRPPEFAPEIKRESEPGPGPSYPKRKRARRSAAGPVSKKGRQARKTKEIISDSFGERKGEGLRRSSRITIDKSRTLSLLSSSSSSPSPFVRVKEPDEFSFG